MEMAGLITIQSAQVFQTTLEGLLAALKEQGVTIFCRIDHATGAASANLPLRPRTPGIFGNSAAGRPLMQAAQTAGIELPSQILVWKDINGPINLTYNEPPWSTTRD